MPGTAGLAVEYVELLAAVRLVTGVCGVYQIDNGGTCGTVVLYKFALILCTLLGYVAKNLTILHQISKRNSISVRSMYVEN